MTPRSRFIDILCSGALAGALFLAPLALPAPAWAVSDDPVLKRMDAVLEENARLREDAWKAHKNGDREAARQAADGLAGSEERLERARAESLAHVANVSPSQVEAMRREGKSWGQAASELGVHPGFLGVNKTPLYEPQSTRKAKAAEAAKAARGKKKPGVKGKDADKEPAGKGKAGDTAGKKGGGKAKGGEPKAKAGAKGKASGPKAKAAPEKAKGKAKTADKPEKKGRKAKKAEKG